MLLSVLISTLTKPLIVHAIGCATSHQLGLSHVMQIHYQLATAKKGSSSITEYFQSFKAMCDNLAAAKHHLHDFESISYLLAGLGSDYDPFVTSITTRLDPLSPQMKSMVIFLPMRCGSNITFLPLSLPCQRLIFLPKLQCHRAEAIVIMVATTI